MLFHRGKLSRQRKLVGKLHPAQHLVLTISNTSTELGNSYMRAEYGNRTKYLSAYPAV